MSSLSEKTYYKWIVAGLLGFLIFTTLGFVPNARGLYLKTVSEDLHVPRSIYALSDIFRYAACAAVNASFGPLLQKFGAKKMLVVGIAIMGLSQLACAMAQDMMLVCLGSMLLGLGFNSFSAPLAGCIVDRWFTKDRGVVLGVVFSASGIGAAVATMLLRPIITGEASFLGFTGWRASYWLVAALMFAMILIVALLYRDAPAPGDDVRRIPKKKRGRAWTGLAWEAVKKKHYFYLLCVAVFLSGSVIQGVYGISTAHLEDVQLDSAYITGIVTAFNVGLFIAKILLGLCYDHFGLPITALVCQLPGALAFGLLACVSREAPGFGLAYELLSAIALTQETILLPLLASDLFGEKSSARVLGIFVSVAAVGYAISSYVMNYVSDRFHSYRPVLIASAILLAAVTVLMQMMIFRGEKVREQVLAAQEAEGED